MAIGLVLAAYMLKADHLQQSDSLIFLAILAGVAVCGFLATFVLTPE